MKRPASATPPSSPLITPSPTITPTQAHSERDIKPHLASSDYFPTASPSPSPTKRAKVTPSKSKTRASPSNSGGGGNGTGSTNGSTGKKRAINTNNPGWTPDKKEGIIARLLTIGIKGVNMAELASEFGLTKSQLSNAIQVGHKGNLRDKAAKAVRGD